MLKREQVWRYLADQTLDGSMAFQQQEIALELDMSIGNVNLAIQPLRDVGAVEVVNKKLIVRDIKKLLVLWAARRTSAPVVASFAGSGSFRETMRVLPSRLTLTSFAGFAIRFPERPEPAPASTIRAYVDPQDAATLSDLRSRFSEVPLGRPAMIVVHAADALMAAAMPSAVPPAQLYVDLWSESDFYAGDYLRAL